MSEIPLVRKTFEPGEDIFREGEHGSEAYLIKKGYVTVWRFEGEKRVNVATLDQGTIIGEMALIDETVRSATVTAQTRVEVEVITQKEMTAMLSKAPETLRLTVHQLLESLRCANDLISAYASRPPSSEASLRFHARHPGEGE